MVAVDSFRCLLPGIALLVGLGLLARGLTAVLPVGSHLVVVIALGALLANTVGIPETTRPGVSTHGLWLEIGIILMGASIALDQVAAEGSRVLVVVGFTVSLTIVTVEALSRGVFDVPEKVGSLLASGSSICGVSAVVAVAGSIRPTQKQIVYAVGTVLLFDAMTLVVYPVVGRLLGLPDVVFGIWAGATMFSTGPVAAAGFAYSPEAGEWAVLVKLTRNALIGVVAIGYALYYVRRGATETTVDSNVGYLWESFPKFILGFVALMLLGSAGLISEAETAALGNASNWLFLVAFAGLGLSIDIQEARSTGVQPVLVVLTSLLLVSTVTLLVLLAIF